MTTEVIITNTGSNETTFGKLASGDYFRLSDGTIYRKFTPEAWEDVESIALELDCNDYTALEDARTVFRINKIKIEVLE